MSEIINNTVAIVLSGGKGKRMGSDVPKQYLEVCGKPLLYYTLKTFEDSFVEKIVLVCGSEDEDYCKNQIIDKYGFTKVCAVAFGGKERYHSVRNGLKCIRERLCTNPDNDRNMIVFIHDGARPLIDEDTLRRCYEDTVRFGSGVAAVPSKDTVKIADEDGFALSTPARNSVYLMQTPQTFSFDDIYSAYEKLIEKEDELKNTGVIITDDAMVMESFTDKKVKLSMGNYRNIKITTPEDLNFMESVLNYF